MDSWMVPAEAISGKEAEVFVTLGGKRYNYGHMTQFEATVEVKKTEVPTIGRKMTGHKISGLTGKFKGKLYYKSSEYRKAWIAYKNGSGPVPVFEICETNEDDSTSSGRQTVVLKECMSDSFTLAKFDVSSEALDEDIEGTFDDCELPETFAVPSGMEG